MSRSACVAKRAGLLLQPLAVAKLLKALVDKEQPQLVMLGKQAIDDDANQVGQMLAALLGWPQATFASKVSVAAGKASVTRPSECSRFLSRRQFGPRKNNQRDRRPCLDAWPASVTPAMRRQAEVTASTNSVQSVLCAAITSSVAPCTPA